MEGYFGARSDAAKAARAAFEDLVERWGARYPAIVRLWDHAWEEFIPFLDYDLEVRTVLCSTNAIVKASTPGTVGPCAPGGTSRPSRQP